MVQHPAEPSDNNQSKKTRRIANPVNGDWKPEPLIKEKSDMWPILFGSVNASLVVRRGDTVNQFLIDDDGLIGVLPASFLPRSSSAFHARSQCRVTVPSDR